VATISRTLTDQVACPADEAFRFIVDPATMPKWAPSAYERQALIAQLAMTLLNRLSFDQECTADSAIA
jgi:hypothetical protein